MFPSNKLSLGQMDALKSALHYIQDNGHLKMFNLDDEVLYDWMSTLNTGQVKEIYRLIDNRKYSHLNNKLQVYKLKRIELEESVKEEINAKLKTMTASEKSDYLKQIGIVSSMEARQMGLITH